MALAVGIPKEIKPRERRVGLTPSGVYTLTKNQIPVYVEQNAGTLSGFSDQEYEKAGARLVPSAKELWRKADLIKKVKEPIPEEFKFFESRHVIFTYLHLASPAERPLLNALLQSKVTGVAYETIEKNGDTPLLKPMSEVAGILAAYFAGIFQNHAPFESGTITGIESVRKMMEEVAFQYPKVPKDLSLKQITILGGGHVGENAARMSCAMGGTVFLSEVSEKRRQQLEKDFRARGFELHLINPADRNSYEQALISSDIIIAAVHVAGKRAPAIIDKLSLELISRQKKKIILDVAIDQGGNVAESVPGDYEHPLYLDSFGNLRFSVTNMPSLCGRGASMALEAVSLDYTLALAGGLDLAIKRYPELQSGINVRQGEVMNPAVLEAHKIDV